MPTVRYTSDGGSYRDNQGNRADPDDPLLDVDEETAGELVDQFRFEYVDEKPSDETEDSGEAPTCAGKDGECTREVDAPGERCWQHEED